MAAGYTLLMTSRPAPEIADKGGVELHRIERFDLQTAHQSDDHERDNQ